MRKRLWIALALSLGLHAGVVTTSGDEALWHHDVAPEWWPAGVDFADADEVLVLCDERIAEEMEAEADDPVVADCVEFEAEFRSAAPFESLAGPIGLGASDALFAGPACNGTIGIGGGAGGAFGGRSGGRRYLRAGAGGMRGGAPVWPDDGLRMFARVAGAEVGEFPLRRTHADAHATAWMASTTLTQTFTNPFDDVVEAVYVFPLPSNAAVNAFEMQVEDRRIVGIVRPREEAERIYQEARRAGKTASLLTQERPNVFTQSVANIAPDESVEVVVTYFHELAFDHGHYEYVLPTLVAPRYATAKSLSDDAAAGPGERVVTAMAPPRAGSRLGDLSLSLTIEAGVPIDAVVSPTHEIASRLSGTRALVEVPDAPVGGDIVIRWRVAGDDELRPGVVAHSDPDLGGYFSLFVVPMLDPSGAEVGAREITFVMDTSGSMGGVPIKTSRSLVESALRGLRPYDRFNVLRFAGSSGGFRESPVAATPENVAAGIAYVRTLASGGGTEMMKGLRAWITQPHDPRYLRTVVFLTDGHVSEEEEILATIRADGRAARWFAFGIGNNVNRYLIEGIAEEGHGAHEIVPAHASKAAAAAERLLARFDAPLLLDARLDVGDLALTDISPERLSDLFAGRPLVVTGRYSGAVRGTVHVRGSVGGREIAIPIEVDLPEVEPENAGLAAVWARSQVATLEDYLIGTEASAEREDLLAEIEALGLAHSLVTRRTSFVAVDDARTVGDGRAPRMLSPLEIPGGVRYWGEVGAPRGARGVEVPSWGLLLADARNGELMVARVHRRSAAARAGLYRGFVIEAVDGSRVHDARHFRDLLRAAPGEVTLRYRNGAGDVAREVRLGGDAR